MSSLAAVHTAAAIVVRALGDAGVSDQVSLELGVLGIVVRPRPGSDDWNLAVSALAGSALQGAELWPYGVIGHVDDVPVTASSIRPAVVA